jgi:hypothetical protein
VTEETTVKTLYKYSSFNNNGYKEADDCGKDYREVLGQFVPVVPFND